MKWLQDNAYWLVPAALSLMGSLATKLSKYPQSKPATLGAAVLAFVRAQIIDRMSLQPHADSPAHLQLGPVGVNVPLLRSLPPGAKPWLSMGNGVPPAAPPAMLLAILIGSSLLGCGHLTGKQVWQDVVDCSAPAIQAELPGLLDEARQALTGPAPNWPQLLLMEGAKTIPVVVCAVSKIVNQASSSAPTLAEAQPHPDNTTSNGLKYLEARKSSVTVK